MFSLFWKPERIASALYEPVLKATNAILEENILQLERHSIAYMRYYIGSWILVNFLCEMWVRVRIEDVLGKDRNDRAIHVGQLLKAAHLEHFAKEWNPTLRVSDVMVWDAEVRMYQGIVGPHSVSAWHRCCEHFNIPVCQSLFDTQPLTDAVLTDLQEGRLFKVCRPLVEIVLDLYTVRGLRWISDLTEGAFQQYGKPGGTFLWMPACRSLIMQVTGDSTRAGNDAVSPLSVSVALKSVFVIKESVDKILS
jgi:hypothetical protein